MSLTDEFAQAILVQQHQNKSQAGLSRTRRQKDVAEVLSVVPKIHSPPSSSLVILIDNIMINEATLVASKHCLLVAGSGPVYGLVLAHVLQKDYSCLRAAL